VFSYLLLFSSDNSENSLKITLFFVPKKSSGYNNILIFFKKYDRSPPFHNAIFDTQEEIIIVTNFKINNFWLYDKKYGT